MPVATGPFPADQIRRDLEARYPSLTLGEDNGVYTVSGSYDLRQDGRLIARYRLRIELPGGYPETIPLFYETGNRILRTQDNHINESNGTLCLGVTEQIWLDLGGQFELLPLLDRHLRSYLIGATSMLAGKGWPFGERSHGADGLCEFYGEKIGTTDPLAVLDLILLLMGGVVKGHWDCPCGSGARLRDCHDSNVRELNERKLPREMLLNSGRAVAAKMRTDVSLTGRQEQKLKGICRRLAKFEGRNRRHNNLPQMS